MIDPFDTAVDERRDERRDDRRAARVAFRGVSRKDRVEVCKLAKQGATHPDPAIAALAANWARSAQDYRWNWLPFFVLPLGGPLMVFVGSCESPNDLPSQVMGVGGGVLICIVSLLAWNDRIFAKRVRALPAVELVDDQRVEN